MQDLHSASGSTQKPDALMSGWISRTDLAHQLGVTEDTLRRWNAKRSGPPCIRAGRKTFYRRETVLDWLEEQETHGHQRKRWGGRR